MKTSNTHPLKLLPATLCLVGLLSANHLRAAVTYWDPEGTFTPTAPSAAYTGQPSSQTPPVPGTLAGTWESTSWSTSGSGSATPVGWVEGTAACFAVGGGSTNNPNNSPPNPDSTTTFTVTMNANHTVAGMFVGLLAPNAVNVTVAGTGIMTMQPANLNGFGLYDSSDGAHAVVTLNVPMAGGNNAGICPEYNGVLNLNGLNTYSGGTYLGYNNLAFGAAVWQFNNNSSFGTGPIIILNSIGGALVGEDGSPINITNAVTMYNKYSPNVNTVGSTPQPATLNLVGNSQGVTFSGPWALSEGSGWTGANIYASTAPWGTYTVLNLNAGHGANDFGDVINISGNLSGRCVLTKGGSGILTLSGNNSAFSGPLVITNGVLRVGSTTALGCNGALSTNGTVTVASGAASGGTAGTLDLNGYTVDAALVLNGNGALSSPVANAGTLINNGALVNSNLASTAVLNGGSGVLAAQVTSPFSDTAVVPPVSATVTGGGGSGATAMASLGVTTNTFTITPGTQKYTVLPTITVSGGGGSNAIVAFNLAGTSPNVVSGTVTVTCPGSGFSSAPTVSFTGGTKSGSGTAPTITANGNNFQVVGLQVTAPGSGYTSAPTITVSGTGITTGSAVGLIDSVTLGSASSIGGPGNTVINSVINDAGLGYGLSVVGPGTVSLTAANTYSGITMVSGGKLVGVVGGSCSNSSVEVVTGTANTLGIAIPDNTKQWTCANLTFDDSTTALEFNFGSVTPSTTLAPLYVSGSVTFAGTPTLTVAVAGSLPAGTYPLLTAPGGLVGTAPTLVNLPPHMSGSLTSDGFTLSLTITANTEPLTWATSGSGAWDLNATQPWKDRNGTLAGYQQTATTPPLGDAVVFDDTYITADSTATLNTTVTPAAVTVNNSAHNYTISGTGGIAGEGGLSKQGSAQLTLACANTYSGGTTISAGTLQLGDGTANNGSVYGNIADNGSLVFANPNAQTFAETISGTGSVTVAGPGTLTLLGAQAYSGGTTISAGTLQLGDGLLNNGSVPGNIANNGSLVFANPYAQTVAGNITGSGSLTTAGLAPLTLTGAAAYAGGTTINSTLILANAAPQTLSSVISGSGMLVQNGPGTLTLTGANTYTGGTAINGAGTVLSVSAIDDFFTSGIGLGTTGPLLLGGGTLQYTGSAAATTARTVSGSGTLDLPAGSLELQLAKSGTITKTSAGTLTLSGTADNASLGLTINAGTVVLNKASASSVHAVGSTTVINSGAKLVLSGSGGDQIYSGVNVTNNSGGIFEVNGVTEGFKTLNLAGNGAGAGALLNSGSSATLTLSSGVLLLADTTVGGSGSLTIPSVINGAFALNYAGTATLTLGGASTYTGGTTISSGTVEVSGSLKGNVNNPGGVLQLDKATALASTATLTLASAPAAGAVNLNFAGTQTIAALNFGATSMAHGTWGKIGSGAQHENAAFTGTGILSVSSGGPTPTATTITSITGTTVSYTGGTGSLYILLGTNNVSAPQANWIPVATNGSTPGSFTIPAVGSSAAQFYRVKSE